MSDAVEGTVSAGKGVAGKKVFGVSLWIWVIAAVVIFYLYRKYTAQNASAAPVDPTASGSSAVGGSATGIDPSTGVPYAQELDPNTGLTYGSENINPITGQANLPGYPGISNAYGLATNTQWSQSAADALIAQGMNASTVSNALAAYLGGSQLTADEVAVVQKAVALYGEPPGGVLPINAAPAPAPAPVPSPKPPVPSPKPPVPAPKPPAPKPKPKPPVGHPKPKPKPKPPSTTYSSYTVKHGDNLWNIVKHYHGNVTLPMVDEVAKLNHISDPNLIHPGQVIKIPHTL